MSETTPRPRLTLAMTCAPLVLVLVGPPSAAASPHACEAVAARALATCIQRTALALRSCAPSPSTSCPPTPAAARAASGLRRKVLGRCTAAAMRDGGIAPPFEPADLATRLERACLGNAAAIVASIADALGPSALPSCTARLGAVAPRLLVRGAQARAACVLRGATCDDARLAARLAALADKARRKSAQRCGADPLVDGVLARAAAGATCALAQALPATAACAPSGPEALVDLWRLATPRPPGTVVRQVSSYDRTGGNVDQGIGPDVFPYLIALGLPTITVDNSYLYQEGGRYVVFDELGPGVLWRIWMTGLDALLGAGLGGDIAVELDGEAVPRVQLTRAALFSGVTPPFLAPLAGDRTVSSGGFYVVAPMPFARRLRITTSVVPNWVQVTYSRLPPDQAVASFDPADDTTAVANLLSRAGDPATTVTPASVDVVGASVAPGTSQTLWSRSRPGTIVRLELLAPAGAEIPVGLRLRATFDGAPVPQVDAPLDDLFGASLGDGARSFAFGRDGDRYYCYFPMPFTTDARLELVNGGSTAFAGWTVRVGVVGDLPPGPLAYFHAAAASAHVEPDGRDYVMLEGRGAGHVVGIVLTAGCAGVGLCELPILVGVNGAHLEGDERIAIDGSRWPQVHGTGLEDAFNGGFYFVRGPFRLPTHGNPVQVPATSPRRPGVNLRSVYRVFLGDAIPFEQDVRVAIEHGPVDDVPAELSSLIFYYAAVAPTLVETDRVTLGDPGSEAAHALVATPRSEALLTSAFRGDASDVPVARTVTSAGVTRFEVAISPPNRGVRLRRLADIGGGTQIARVLVDGALAGVWQTTEVNPVLRWADLDFELPAALTAGRSRLAVEIDASDSPAPWTAAEYVAFVH